MKSIGNDDENGVFEAIASLTFFSREQIQSENFGTCSQGIIDVSAHIYIQSYFTCGINLLLL